MIFVQTNKIKLIYININISLVICHKLRRNVVYENREFVTLFKIVLISLSMASLWGASKLEPSYTLYHYFEVNYVELYVYFIELYYWLGVHAENYPRNSNFISSWKLIESFACLLACSSRLTVA